MIAVLGIGSMGAAVAEDLLKAGHQVTVWNRTRQKTDELTAMGAEVAESAASAIRGADLTITVFPDVESTREVLFSPETLPSLSNSVLLNVAHTTPDEIVRLAAEVAEHGGNLSEVNVSVYPDPVRNRQGHFNVATDPEHKDLWMGVFRSLGAHVHYVGAVGNASKAEFALWLSYMFNPVAIAYSAAAFARLGLPKEALISALSENPTLRVAAAEDLIPQMIDRAYRTDTFSVQNFGHSVDLVTPDAAALGLPTELFTHIRALFSKTTELGFGDLDVSAVYEALNPD